MNDMVSPSQSSPSMMANAGQKANTSAENAALVRKFPFQVLFTFLSTLFITASDKAKASRIS